VKSAPEARGQLRIARYSMSAPSTDVDQFWFPAITWARPRTIAARRSIPETWASMALASSTVRLVIVPEPCRTVPGPRPWLPEET